MAAPFVNYTPAATPGAYDFEQADGRKLRLFGPPAEDLKARIDASASLAPQPVAGPGGGDGGGPNTDSVMFGGGGNMSLAPPEPPPAVSVAPQAPPAPAPSPEAVPPPPPGIAAPPPPPTPEEQQGIAIANQSLQDAASAMAPKPYVMKYRNPDGSVVEEQEGTGKLRVFRPGSAGSKGGLVETTSSESRQGGFNPSLEHIERKGKILDMQAEALDMAHQAGQERAALESGYLQETQKREQQAAIEAEQEIKDRQAKVAELESKYNAVEKDYRSAKVDPMRSQHGFAGFLGAIAQGLGAYAATVGRTKNFAMDIIQQRIANDIRAQETELNVKRDAANNDLARLNRELGSPELAKKALEGIRLKQSETAFRSLAAQTQSKELEAKHLANAAALAERHADWLEEYRIAADGTVTRSKNFVNRPGSPGRAAGYDLPTAGDLKTVQDLGPKEGGKERAVPHATVEDFNNAAKALNQAAILESLLGKEKAGIQGEELDDPTKGPVDALRFQAKDTLNQETRRAAQAFQAARGKSDMDAVLATQDAIGSGSLASRKRAIAMLRREMSQQMKGALAGVPPDQAKRLMQTLDPKALEQYTREEEGPK